MNRPVLFLIFIALSCFAAALYGALHNQVSYSVGPSYFTDLKFAQFQIPADLHNRFGAGVVGVLASWWMGLFIGLPIAFLCVLAPDAAIARKRFTRALVITLGVAALGAALSYGLSLMHSDADLRATFVRPPAFIRAGALHDGSYIGAALGFVIALWSVARKLREDRR